ncbi:MAG: DUF58 domain-containing protein [Magnetococcales bacterium]|nr:DUF58 domain-containing protein [Magnetococcales bacterium]
MKHLISRILWRGAWRVTAWSHWFSQSLTPMGKRVAAGAFLAAIFGINTELSMVYQVFSLLLSLFFLSVIAAFFTRVTLEGYRTLPAQVMVNKPFEYELRLRNPSGVLHKDVVIFETFPDPRPSLEQFMQARQEPEERRRNAYDRWVGYYRFVRLTEKNRGIRVAMISLEPLDPHGETRLRLRATATRRGGIHFSGLLVGRADPFGLFRRFTRCHLPGMVLAVPEVHPLPQRFRIPGGRKHLPGGITMAVHVGEQDEFFALRDYRTGDSPRAMYWPGLAKTGKPVVVERQEEFFTRHALVLDTLNHVPEAVFEDAVSLAASLAVGHDPLDALLDFMFVGLKSWQFTSGRGFGGSQRILEILAHTQPHGDQPFSRLANLVLSQAKRFSSIILVLIHWDRDRESLIHSLRAMGLPMRVFLIQDDQASPAAVAPPHKTWPGFHVLRSGTMGHGLQWS